jgi:hypothetical protein
MRHWRRGKELYRISMKRSSPVGKEVHPSRHQQLCDTFIEAITSTSPGVNVWRLISMLCCWISGKRPLSAGSSGNAYWGQAALWHFSRCWPALVLPALDDLGGVPAGTTHRHESPLSLSF